MLIIFFNCGQHKHFGCTISVVKVPNRQENLTTLKNIRQSVKVQTATVGTLALASDVSVRRRRSFPLLVINCAYHFCLVSVVEVLETLANLTTMCLCS